MIYRATVAEPCTCGAVLKGVAGHLPGCALERDMPSDERRRRRYFAQCVRNAFDNRDSDALDRLLERLENGRAP